MRFMVSVYIKEDSYERRKELAADGYKFNKTLKWHKITQLDQEQPVKTTIENGVFTFDLEDSLQSKDMTIEKVVENAVKAYNQTQHPTDWVGTIGERREFSAVLEDIILYRNDYGSRMVKFKDAEGHNLLWFTAAEIKCNIGDKIILRGTIKEHSERKGIKSTILSRCNIKKCGE